MKWQQSIIMGLLITFFFGGLEAFVDEVTWKMTQRAKESQTDVILVMRDGNIVYAYQGENKYVPIETRSVTKSFASLAIGLLLQECKITSIDTPVYYFFPEMKQGIKQEMTIRHLLSNTSGIVQDPTGASIYEAPDIVKFPIASDLCTKPGTHFIYNNKAVNLLSGIVESASGMRLQEYLRCKLFQPLGIVSDSWPTDMAGHNYAMSHLTISAFDLSKVGLLIANEGCWNGKRLLAKEWIEAISQPSQSVNPFYGFLWWLDYCSMDVYWDKSLIDYYRKQGVTECYLKSLEQLNGQVFTFLGHVSYGNFNKKCAAQLAPTFGSEDQVYRFFIELESKGLPLARWNEGELKSFSARGYLGQKLTILPSEKIVAVRLARSCGQSGCGIDTFADFDEVLEELVNELGARGGPFVECAERS